MNKDSLNDELFNKAFRLAYFIHCDRRVAMRIATEALGKLDIACGAQDKRLYYTPTGRPSTRVSRTKVRLSEPQLLQRLVYIGSETEEREKEASNRAEADEMIVHYIKHLVRITTKRNSFYVALGLSRLLHNYSTTETANLYGQVVQNPDRVRDDYYYRSRKGCLMRELKERFGDVLTVVKGQRGEERFQTEEPSMKLKDLVNNCLRAFTPWDTHCVVPEGHDPFTDTIERLSFYGDDPDQEHEVEVNRFHSILHPDCFERLTGSLDFDSPLDRLGIPHFSLSGADSGQGDSRNQPPDLDEDELRDMRSMLAEESARRRVAVAGLMKVMVDGVERARFDPRKQSKVKMEVSSDAELIEIHSSDERGDVALAAFFTDFESVGESNQNQSITLEGGQKLSFSVSLLKDSMGEVEGAAVEIAYRETSAARAALLGLNQLIYRASNAFSASGHSRGWVWKPVFALVLLTLFIGGLLFALSYNEQLNRDNQIAIGNKTEVEKSDPDTQPQTAQNVLPDQREENKNSNQPPQSRPQQRRPPITDENLVARNLPDADPNRNDPNASQVRSARPRIVGAMLPEVIRIRVEVLGDEETNHQVVKYLSDALNDTNRFTAVESIDEAQAELKVTVIIGTSSRKGTLVARLVNESGYVLWPARTSGAGATYAGTAEEVVPLIIRDLMRESARQDRIRK